MPSVLRSLKKFYATDARKHLPWRKTTDPYKILVSEMMLQQTQVDRVVPFYERFIKRFPTPHKLSQAPLSEVLTYWQGLGYNRRARYLHLAAKAVAAQGWPENLEVLPGVGPYTARAVAAFAYNRPEVFVETNIRTVIFHSNVLQNTRTSDAELLPLVEALLKRSKMQPRDFYAAFMDYGSHLKRQGVRLNNRSKHYIKQTKFEGSARQLRGAIVRELLQRPATAAALTKKLSRTPGEIEKELLRLKKEGMVRAQRGKFSIA
jgi:A/G-specific adenine glycosylase